MEQTQSYKYPGEDESLISRSSAGDRIAFDRLVLKHRDRIRGLCMHLLGDCVGAEDAAKDVFASAYRLSSRFRGNHTFAVWLLRLAVLHCRKIHKRKYSKKNDLFRKATFDDTRYGLTEQEAKDESVSAEKVLTRRRLTQVFYSSLGSLEYSLREVIVLRDIMKLDYPVIESICGLSKSVLFSRLEAGRRSISDHLAAY